MVNVIPLGTGCSCISFLVATEVRDYECFPFNVEIVYIFYDFKSRPPNARRVSLATKLKFAHGQKLPDT